MKGEIHMKVFLFNEEVYLVKLNKITIYIDNEVFDSTQNYSNIQSSPTEVTQKMFLDEL